MDILLCVCIIFILIIIHTVWPHYVYDPQYDKLNTIDVLSSPPDTDLRTGDIIFVKNCTKCKYTDDYMNNGFQYVYRNMFNTCRWYLTSMAPYTHVAVIVRLNIDGETKPYICHVDGGAPMYDEIRRKYIAGMGVVVSKLNYINTHGGAVHMYRYKGLDIKKNMNKWISTNEKSVYPSSLYKLTMSNALKWDKNPKGVMACTDFVENTLAYMEIISKDLISSQSTINDVVSIVKNNKLYEHTPVVLKNKCYDEKHFG